VEPRHGDFAHPVRHRQLALHESGRHLPDHHQQAALPRGQRRGDDQLAGGSWPNIRIDMGELPFDHAAASTTFASNLGPDSDVLNGPSPCRRQGNGAGFPGQWYITIR
jgi:hypothetical protein